MLTREIWNKTCLSAGIPAIKLDTCARIMAVLYVHGNNEEMTHNKGFRDDVEYIQSRFGLHGGGTPAPCFVELFQKYVKELETINEQPTEQKGDALFRSNIPEWAKELYKRRYGMKLL